MRSTDRNVLLLVIISLGLTFAIFVESSQPPLPIIGQTPGLDKVAHFTAFGLLASLLYLTAKQLRSNKWLSPFVITLIIITTIGLSDELYQLLNPARAFDIYDLLADIAGACFFIVLLKLRNYIQTQFSSNTNKTQS